MTFPISDTQPIRVKPHKDPLTLQIEINQLQDQKEDLQGEYRRINGRYISAEVVFGISILGLIFFFFLWPLWAFLLIISILTWASNVGHRNSLSNEIEELKENIRAHRDLMVQLQSK